MINKKMETSDLSDKVVNLSQIRSIQDQSTLMNVTKKNNEFY